MQLVDEGLVELDVPVQTYLPEFDLADGAAAAAITARHLLSHTGGFEGDAFTDTGTGDECLKDYVALLFAEPQLFAPGTMFSYNNAGFCVLGRLVEVLRGAPYDECLRRYLIEPLGLTQIAASPYEAILHRAAVGHLPTDDGQWQASAIWALPRSLAPAGAMLAMSARDLVTFGRSHLDLGVTRGDRRILSAASVQAMQERQIATPWIPNRLDQYLGWGLGWEVFDWPTGRVIGHDGGALGQRSFLRVVPGSDVVVALLTNGGNANPLYEAVFSHVLDALAGVSVPPFQTAPQQPRRVDAARYVGAYQSRMSRSVVTQDEDGRVWLEQTPLELADTLREQPHRTELLHYRDDSFVAADTEEGLYFPYTFVGGSATQPAQFLHTGRADPRVAWNGQP